MLGALPLPLASLASASMDGSSLCERNPVSRLEEGGGDCLYCRINQVKPMTSSRL